MRSKSGESRATRVVGVRLSTVAAHILDVLSASQGTTKRTIMEHALRHYARAQGMTVPSYIDENGPGFPPAKNSKK
jgi:hypothetical protein